MSILDAPFGNLAATLIDSVQLGSRAAVIHRPGEGKTYDPATGQVGGGNPDEDYPCRVVFEEFNDRLIDGALVQQGDRKAIVARQTIGIVPKAASDVLIMGTDPYDPDAVTWEIVRVMGTSSGEEEAIYSLHIRR